MVSRGERNEFTQRSQRNRRSVRRDSLRTRSVNKKPLNHEEPNTFYFCDIDHFLL
jgi:hypothetical protein